MSSLLAQKDDTSCVDRRDIFLSGDVIRILSKDNQLGQLLIMVIRKNDVFTRLISKSEWSNLAQRQFAFKHVQSGMVLNRASARFSLLKAD